MSSVELLLKLKKTLKQNRAMVLKKLKVNCGILHTYFFFNLHLQQIKYSMKGVNICMSPKQAKKPTGKYIHTCLLWYFHLVRSSTQGRNVSPIFLGPSKYCYFQFYYSGFRVLPKRIASLRPMLASLEKVIRSLATKKTLCTARFIIPYRYSVYTFTK